MTRLEANIEILKILSEYLEKNPDMRFGQALNNLGIVEQKLNIDGSTVWENYFYIESEDTLNRMKKGI
jgi:hypothetical protein